MLEEEIEYRKASWIDREAIDSSTGIRSRKAWTKKVREFTQQLMQDFKADDVSKTLTFEKYLEEICLFMPSGSGGRQKND